MRFRNFFHPAITIILLFLISLLSACISAPITATPFPTSTETSTPYPDTACGWQWAYKDLPELTEQWRSELAKLSLPIMVEQTTAYAFGENCFGQNGEIIRFAGMETDFNIGLTVQDLNDLNERTALVEPIMHLVIDSFTTVSPRPGFVEFHFQSATEQQSLRVQISDAESAFEEGKTGIVFYNAVTSQP